MVTTRNRKPAGKPAHKAAAKPKTVKAKPASPARKVPVARKPAAAPARKPAAPRAPSKRAPAKSAKAVVAAKPARPAGRPASVKSAAQAVAAARAGAIKRRAPSYIPRSRFDDDWMMAGPVELPRQPNPAAHTPTRKPPKPRAPKPKAISHEQAVANLKALLESRKRKDRSDSVAAAKSA